MILSKKYSHKYLTESRIMEISRLFRFNMETSRTFQFDYLEMPIVMTQ